MKLIKFSVTPTHMLSVCAFMCTRMPFPFQGDKITVHEYVFKNDRKEAYLENYEAKKIM